MRGTASRARVETRIEARVDALEQALDAGGYRLDEHAARRARTLVGKVNERLRLSGDHTVVALAGATGSGKSSLFNALSNLDIAPVGVRRPTTSHVTACVWGAEGADRLLEWLEVPRQHRVSHESALDRGEDALRGLVLLDLPDYDSTELSHRIEVDRLVELVDVFVWVTDPQKYADAALHRRYLSRLAGHDAVTLVVLNQSDRLDSTGVEACRRDLARLVAADGLPDVEVLPTSAVTGAGIDRLRTLVGKAVGRRTARNERLSADLDAVASELSDGVGTGEAPTTELGASTGLVEALADAAGVPVVVRAVERAYLRDALATGGWPLTRWARRLRPDPLRRLRLGQRDAAAGGARPARMPSMREQAGALLDKTAPHGAAPDSAAVLARSSLPAPTAAQRSRVEVALRRVGQSAAQDLPDRWAQAVQTAAQPAVDDLHDALDQAVVGTDLALRRPAWWVVAGWLQRALALAAVAGLVWLVALGVTGWLRLPEPGTPYLGPLPVPTLLLVGGLVIGALLGVLVRAAAGPAARRRGRRVRRVLLDAVDGVAQQRVIAPVAAVLDDHRSTREALAQVSS